MWASWLYHPSASPQVIVQKCFLEVQSRCPHVDTLIYSWYWPWVTFLQGSKFYLALGQDESRTYNNCNELQTFQRRVFFFKFIQIWTKIYQYRWNISMECAIIVEDLTLAIPVKFGSNWFSSFSHVLAGSRRIEELVSRTSKTSFLQSLVPIGSVVLVMFWRDQDKMRN